MIKIRRFKEGDQHGIVSLSNQVFPDFKFSVSDWKWRHEKDKNNIFVAVYGEKIVGHWCYLKRTLVAGDRKIKAGFTLAAMVEPRWQQRGTFSSVARYMLKDATSKKIMLLFGFPNDLSLPIHLKLGFRKVNDYRIFSKRITEFKKEKFSSNFVFKFVNSADKMGRFEDNEAIIRLKKTLNYLNWRYFEKPGDKYLIVSIRKNNKTIGYMVLKKYTLLKKPNIQLIDVCADNNRGTSLSILEFVKNISEELDVRHFSTWRQSPGSIEDLIVKVGNFKVDNPKVFHLVCKPLCGEGENFIRNKEWNIKMGDTEIF